MQRVTVEADPYDPERVMVTVTEDQGAVGSQSQTVRILRENVPCLTRDLLALFCPEQSGGSGSGHDASSAKPCPRYGVGFWKGR